MQLTQNIAFDFAAPGITPRVYAMQGDRGSRLVTISLYNQGTAWEVQASVAVQYRIPSGATGLYDQIDGESAIAVTGNEITAQLAEPMFQEPGAVHCELLLTDASGSVTTWPFLVMVQEASTNGAEIPENYYNAFLGVVSSTLDAAAKAEEAAIRAENAAGSADPENQMSKTMYDPDGAVETAGGIPKYVAAASFIPTSQKATANGVATLDSTGKIPTTQLPSLEMEESTSNLSPTLTVTGTNVTNGDASSINYFRAGKLAILSTMLSFTTTSSAPTVILSGLQDAPKPRAEGIALIRYASHAGSTTLKVNYATVYGRSDGDLSVQFSLSESITSVTFSVIDVTLLYGVA